jgi:chromosome partitioning protein
MDTVIALGWPGPPPAETEPLGWFGVSRETLPPVPVRTPTGPARESHDTDGAIGAASDAAASDAAEPGSAEPESAEPAPAGPELAVLAPADLEATVAAPDHPLLTKPETEHAVEPEPPPVPLRPTRPMTASEIAAGTPENVDTSLPLAQATEHSLAVAQGRPVRRILPRPAECRVMVVANQKGGVGKTTTAVNVAAALAQHGMRVLVVDLDPQGNASTALAVDHTEGTAGAYQVLIDSTPIADVVVPCPDIDGLMVIPASIDLAGAEIELVSLVARETRLRRALLTYLAAEADAGRRFDYVFIDCPPSLGLLTVNALSAGREMLIPIQCEYYALEGLSQLLRTLDQIREHLNPELELGAILLTMFDGRTRLAAGVADEVRQHFGERVLTTAIPRSVRISEAPSYGQTVLTYDPGSPGALSYLEAASELAHQGEEN